MGRVGLGWDGKKKRGEGRETKGENGAYKRVSKIYLEKINMG